MSDWAGASRPMSGRRAPGGSSGRQGLAATGAAPHERRHPLHRDHLRPARGTGRRPGGGASIGLVPTMGALHEGHLALIRAARAQNDVVVVSIFVNPTQFNAGEDLEKYPRDLARDLALAEGAGADLAFAPRRPRCTCPGLSTWVDVEGLTKGSAGRRRPGHFRGVCTVVTKLFNICRPRPRLFRREGRAATGRHQADGPRPGHARGDRPCPTVREPDGLAMSSRNVRLTPEARAQAPVLYRALTAARTAIENGERDAERLKAGICAGAGRRRPGESSTMWRSSDADDLTPVATIAGSASSPWRCSSAMCG